MNRNNDLIYHINLQSLHKLHEWLGDHVDPLDGVDQLGQGHGLLHSINSMNGLVTMLTHLMGLISLARDMVCFTPCSTPLIRMWVECIAKLLRALSPIIS